MRANRRMRDGAQNGVTLRVLGVDPGSWNTGWGVLEGRRHPRVVACEVIRMRRGMEFAERLGRLHDRFEEVVVRLQPQTAAVEAPFHGVSARSALQLAHARGVILAVLARAGIPVTECSPATVKKAVTDNGRAGKDEVRAIVCRELGLEPDQPDDLTDALAVALCHLHATPLKEAVQRALAVERPATPGHLRTGKRRG